MSETPFTHHESFESLVTLKKGGSFTADLQLTTEGYLGDHKNPFQTPIPIEIIRTENDCTLALSRALSSVTE